MGTSLSTTIRYLFFAKRSSKTSSALLEMQYTDNDHTLR